MTQSGNIGEPWMAQRTGRAERFESVVVPAPHEGVGNALRSAFPTPSNGVQAELERLLIRLG